MEELLDKRARSWCWNYQRVSWTNM